MKKIFLGISAMFFFLAGTESVWSQWPIMSAPYRSGPIQAKVNDGFGGTWNFIHRGNYIYLLRPLPGHSIKFPACARDYYRQMLTFDERSLPPEAGLPLAFYGYLNELDQAEAIALLWVNPDTGEIDDVGFMMEAYRYDGYGKRFLSVLPRNYTMYADILKKTVKFDVPEDIFDPANIRLFCNAMNVSEFLFGPEAVILKPEDGICYQFDIRFPAPAAGEPDFLALPADK